MRSPPWEAWEELNALQESVQALGGPRNVALRMFAASRRSTTLIAQREFWLEFSWLDQQYRDAVRRLARFCLEHMEGFQESGEAPPLRPLTK